MRFSLFSFLVMVLCAAVLVHVNFKERPVRVAGFEKGSEFEAPIYYPGTYQQGWPAIVYEQTYGPTGKWIYRQPWAILINIVFGLTVTAAAGAYAEWRVRRYKPKPFEDSGIPD
ncbi:MAG: hypothetical protein HS116_21150 [Planctomycetes bacterium]|nr:hypothetical protein [Planctomycetota bacterium]